MGGRKWRPKRGRLYGPCFYCGRTEWLTVDHKLPRSRGGTDDHANIVMACAYCNSCKGNKTPEEFSLRRGEEASFLRLCALAPAGSSR